MNIEISAIIFIFASAYLFYIFSIERTEKKREGAGMTKCNEKKWMRSYHVRREIKKAMGVRE